MKTYYLYIFTDVKGERHATVSVGNHLTQGQINMLKYEIADAGSGNGTRAFGIDYKYLELTGDELDEWFDLKENEMVSVLFSVDEDDETDTFEIDD